ncbi:hypothetical protein BDR26DRAFT_916999 [Obelidium mucronatum]|nr:hypothetical protein BDR26DRAFT_916999 [Obelidium mucronatum]
MISIVALAATLSHIVHASADVAVPVLDHQNSPGNVTANPEAIWIKHHYVQGYDWYGFDAFDVQVSSIEACMGKTSTSGYLFYTYNEDTKTCYVKAPTYDPSALLRVADSEPLFNNDFPGSFDVWHFSGYPESTCAKYCTRFGDHKSPPCMVSVYSGDTCYLKYPNKSGSNSWAGILIESESFWK